MMRLQDPARGRLHFGIPRELTTDGQVEAAVTAEQAPDLHAVSLSGREVLMTV